MDEIFKQLKKVGVHYIKSEYAILFEILEDKVDDVNEVDAVINQLLTNLKSSKQNKILFECPRVLLEKLNLTKEKMEIVGERVIFTKEFTEPINNVFPDYEVWSVNSSKSISFLAEVMGKSFNETQRFLKSMNAELPSQINDMYTVLIVNNDLVGVVFPHIEPDTDKEGRIFWIGMHPNYLGKGFGQKLHSLGLSRLQHDFKAKSYVGATKIDNTPMRKILIANGCTQKENTVISLQYRL